MLPSMRLPVVKPPRIFRTFVTGSRRSGLLISQGARGGGASKNLDVRRASGGLARSVHRGTRPRTDHERLATPCIPTRVVALVCALVVRWRRASRSDCLLSVVTAATATPFQQPRRSV